MAITLAEAKLNAQTDYDPAVIDEFRKESALLDAMIFDDAVNPSGGGATLDYGYRRLNTQATADFRELNTEYTPQNVTTTKHVVTLAPLGGAFEVDRVIAEVGPAASASVALNIGQKTKATKARFVDEVINGDVLVGPNGFDGLDKALAGSSTEFRLDSVTDWSDFDTNPRAEHKALDAIDEFLALLDGTPTLIVGNDLALARVRAAARRAGMYTRNPVEDLVGPDGLPITREAYGNLVFVDAGAKAGSNDRIIPVEDRTVDGSPATGLTDLYAVRIGLDGFHGASVAGRQIIKTYLPDFSTPGAVKKGEVEMGPVGVALKATKAAAVFRNIKVR